LGERVLAAPRVEALLPAVGHAPSVSRGLAVLIDQSPSGTSGLARSAPQSGTSATASSSRQPRLSRVKSIAAAPALAASPVAPGAAAAAHVELLGRSVDGRPVRAIEV